MSSIVKISEATSIAFHSITSLAADPERPISTKEIASKFHISEAHLSKVLQRLAKAGLVKSARGPKGGFLLDRPADEITLLDVYEAIDGPLISTTCLLGTPLCGKNGCIFGGMLESVDDQVREYLAGTNLGDLAGRL